MNNELSKNSNKDVGKYGESMAYIYLKKRGFLILSTNLRLSLGNRRGEIDILAVKGSTLYIVEVKAACFDVLGYGGLCPENNLSRVKIRTLHRLRSILLIKLSDSRQEDDLSEIKLEIDSYRQTFNLRHLKTAILGIVVDIDVDRVRGILLRDQITRIKVRVFPDL